MGHQLSKLNPFINLWYPFKCQHSRWRWFRLSRLVWIDPKECSEGNERCFNKTDITGRWKLHQIKRENYQVCFTSKIKTCWIKNLQIHFQLKHLGNCFSLTPCYIKFTQYTSFQDNWCFNSHFAFMFIHSPKTIWLENWESKKYMNSHNGIVPCRIRNVSQE